MLMGKKSCNKNLEKDLAYFKENSKNGKYFKQKIKWSEDILKILNNKDLLDKEIKNIQKTLLKFEEEIAENNVGDYWLLGRFSALDINLAVTVYHLRNLGYIEMVEDKPYILLFMDSVESNQTFEEIFRVRNIQVISEVVTTSGAALIDNNETEKNGKKTKRKKD